jgi:hypothetical protein
MQYIEYDYFEKNIKDIFNYLNKKPLLIKKGKKVYTLNEVNDTERDETEYLTCKKTNKEYLDKAISDISKNKILLQ